MEPTWHEGSQGLVQGPVQPFCATNGCVMPHIPWILWLATAAHSFTGMGLLIERQALMTTACVMFSTWPAPLVGALYLLLSGLAFGVLACRPKWAVWGLLPQQVLVLLTGLSAMNAIVQGAYGDGVLRPQIFIAVDQAAWVGLSAFHTMGLLDYCQLWPYRTR